MHFHTVPPLCRRSSSLASSTVHNGLAHDCVSRPRQGACTPTVPRRTIRRSIRKAIVTTAYAPRYFELSRSRQSRPRTTFERYVLLESRLYIYNHLMHEVDASGKYAPPCAPRTSLSTAAAKTSTLYKRIHHAERALRVHAYCYRRRSICVRGSFRFVSCGEVFQVRFSLISFFDTFFTAQCYLSASSRPRATGRRHRWMRPRRLQRRRRGRHARRGAQADHCNGATHNISTFRVETISKVRLASILLMDAFLTS